jgi:hypothetical protein
MNEQCTSADQLSPHCVGTNRETDGCDKATGIGLKREEVPTERIVCAELRSYLRYVVSLSKEALGY